MVDPIVALIELLDREKDRVVRLWSKRVRAESFHVEVPGRDLREPLGRLVDQLHRLLDERGEEAVRLWPEWVRAHGALRYDQRFEPEDLAREFKALHLVLLRVYARQRGGTVEPEVAEFLADLIGEAIASTEASYVRVVRTEEVRFREAAVMESVLHQVDVGIMVAELDGTLSFATPPVGRLIGVSVATVVGGKVGQVLQPILNQLRARHPGGGTFRISDLPLTRSLREKAPVRGVPMMIDRPDGREITLELSATPIWEEGVEGEIVGVIQTITDRTENAQRAQELLSAYEELRRLQGRLLQRTRTQALGQLASGAAHALNNFLNVLRLRITLMRKGFKVEHLDALDRVVGNIGDLVARLQEFSVSRAEEELSDASFDQVVREALELARSEVERPGTDISMATRLEAAGSFVKVDAGFFRELIVNLMLAARDRMPQGGQLAVHTEQAEGWCTLRIEDTGQPYSEEDLVRLFDPLKGKGKAPQLSLLLAVARNQVQRWGGELECLNCAGETTGAAFLLRLPRVVAEQRPAPGSQESASPPPQQAAGRGAPRRLQATRRVMVVDAKPESADLLKQTLTDEGYEVGVAHNGPMAVQLWEREGYEAALIDASLLPEMDGWELARELRNRSHDALLAIVTGQDVRGQSRAKLAMVDAVFRKPLDLGAVDDFLSQTSPPEEEDPSHHVH